MKIGLSALVVALAVGILAIAFPVEAQPAGKVYRIGVLGTAQPPESMMAAFRLGLREHGYLDGQNVRIEQRWTDGITAGLAELAEEIVRSKVDLILTWGTAATLAAKRATTITPIVMLSASDPVGSGLVEALGRPGGNVTGVSNITRDLMGKVLELRKEAVPGATRIAVLRNAANQSARFLLTETEAAARSLRVRLQLVEVQGPDDLAGAFAAMVRERAGAVVVLPDPVFLTQRQRLAELALKSRVATASNRREYVAAGGLLAYGPSLSDEARYAAKYVDRIFKGARPADLAVEQPTRLELVINLKTAKALRLTIPQSLLRRADEVIQ